MQALILAAGQSSRFYPLANGVHKSMTKVCGKPILEYTILGLEKCGIKNIIIVSDTSQTIQSYFGDGKKFNVSIQYVVQPVPLGAGNGLLLAEKYIKNDLLLLNSSHVDVENFAKKLIDAKTKNNKGVLLVKEKENTWDNGVVKVSDGRIEDLIEKPKKGEEPSKLCVVGLYVFCREFLEELRNTKEEHYQLEKAISSFAKKNYINLVKTEEETVTLKYPWDLLKVKNYILKNIKGSTGKNTNIAKSAEIIGEVIIEDGATIMEGAKIKGSCYIGKNSCIGNNVILRDGVDIGEDVVIGAYMEIKNSIIMEKSKTHSGFIGDSVIGKNCRIAAQFSTANVRLDRSSVKVVVKGQEIDSSLKSLGMIIGDNVRIGIKSSTMPGIIIGQDALIGPSTIVFNNVDAKSRYYSKFQEIVVKK